MKKFAALGLAAALASASFAPVQAEEIAPIKPSVSTQGSLPALGGLGPAAAIGGLLIIGVIIAAASGSTSGTN